MENMKLNNNLECPMLGLGTFMLSPEDAYTSTLEALKMGYSLIDTANAYVNERAVGRAIKDSGIDRKNIFLSTKIWASEYEYEKNPEVTKKRMFYEAMEGILPQLRVIIDGTDSTTTMLHEQLNSVSEQNVQSSASPADSSSTSK